MIKFEALIKKTWERRPVDCLDLTGNCSLSPVIQEESEIKICEDPAIIMMGVEINGVWHFENDVYTFISGSNKMFATLGSLRIGKLHLIEAVKWENPWLPDLEYVSNPIALSYYDKIQKVGNLWSRDPEIRNIVEVVDPFVFSLMGKLGRFSEVMT